jgi:hypothetical protein
MNEISYLHSLFHKYNMEHYIKNLAGCIGYVANQDTTNLGGCAGYIPKLPTTNHGGCMGHVINNQRFNHGGCLGFSS